MRITLTRPDDWHLHLRDGGAMRSVAPHTARQFARAIIMPNLKPPVTTTEQAIAYRQRIMAALPAESDFNPLMTLYLTDHTAPEEIQRAKRANVVACKLYPAGATTHSDAGVTDIENIHPVLEAMEKMGMLLLVHGEVTDRAVDIFDREAVFIDRVLRPTVNRFPGLKIVFEHVTTRDAVDFVRAAPPTVAATITAHHLLYNRNALFQGGVRPHHYCLPVLKRETHRRALIAAAIGGQPKFFLGTDSAPHARHSKETDRGCAGCYTAHGAMELYAEAFDNAGALDRLEGFSSFFGPAFYGLPRNEGTITLVKETTRVPETFEFGKHTLVPLRAGETISWRLEEASNS